MAIIPTFVRKLARPARTASLGRPDGPFGYAISQGQVPFLPLVLPLGKIPATTGHAGAFAARSGSALA